MKKKKKSKKSRLQLEEELFELEQQLDIPYKDRFYNKGKTYE